MYTIVVDIYFNMLFCGEYTLHVYLLFIILAFYEKSTCKGDCENDKTKSRYVYDARYLFLHNENDQLYFRSNLNPYKLHDFFLFVAGAAVQITTWLMGGVKVKKR